MPALDLAPRSTPPAPTPAVAANLLRGGEQQVLDDFSTTSVMVIQGIAMALSAAMLTLAVRRALTARTHFNYGVVGGAVLFFMTDFWYWVVVLAGIIPNSAEITRTVLPVPTSAVIATLSFQRFSVFSSTTYGRWYTTRVRHGLQGFTVLLALGVFSYLVYSYTGIDLTREIETDPWRKRTIIVSTLWTALTDLLLTVLILRIVLQIRATLEPVSSSSGAKSQSMDLTSVGGATSQPGSFARGGGGMGQVDSGAAGMAATSNGMTAQRKARRAAKRHYRNIVQSVLASVVGMLMMVVAGIMTYVASSQVEGQLIASLFLRCYVMCAMVEWRLVIELVRRPTTGGAGGGGARGYTGPSTTVPGTTTTTTLGGPPPALTLRGGQTDSFFAAAPSKPGLTSPPPVYDSAPSTPRSATLSTPRTLVGGSFPLEPLSPRAAMIDAPARTTSTLMRPTLSPPGSIAGPERYAEYQSPAAVSAAAAATAGAQRGSSARTSRVHF